MSSGWIGLGLLAAALAVLQGVLIGLQSWEHRRFVRSRLRRCGVNQATGRAALLVPCRGMDVGLEENLARLFQQDYDDYEIWFILESRRDPAYPLVRRVIEAHPQVPSRLILAGRAKDSGQKVHNLRVATEDLPGDLAYLAFVDADARPARHWLRSLLARLNEPRAGAATGYRWFIPQRPTLANHLLYSLNCNIALLYSRNGPNVIWGGSWAIRREVFERLGIREAWAGTLSDDLVANRVFYEAGLRVAFEPACVVASPLDLSLSQMLSFVRRQYLIGRVYVPLPWLTGFLLITFANLMFLGSAAWAVARLLTGTPGAWLPAGVCLVIHLLNAGRGLIRRDLAIRLFPEWREPLRKAGRFDVVAGPLVNLVNWLALIVSALGRQIVWRGITYRLFSGGRIALLDREELPPTPLDDASPAVNAEPVARRRAA